MGGRSILAASTRIPLVYRLSLYSVRFLAPVVALGTAGILLLRRTGVSDLRRRQAALLVAILATSLLVQFPFPHVIYFCYVAPMLIFAIAAVTATADSPSRPILALVLTFFGLYAALLFQPTGLDYRGTRYALETMAPGSRIERARWLHTGLEYDRAISLIRQHASGRYTYCATDCPDVYFFSGLHNPTRTLFDMFDDPPGRTQRILNALQSHAVTAVVLHRGAFSGEVPADLRLHLEQMYPHSERVSLFEVRWK